MIIPKPEYDALFAHDGVPFRLKMIEYIRREFGDILGARVGLLRGDDAGLEALSQSMTTLQSDVLRGDFGSRDSSSSGPIERDERVRRPA